MRDSVHTTTSEGSHLLVKGANLGANFLGKVRTENQVFLHKGANFLDDIFLTKKEVAVLLGVTERAVQKACKAGKYRTILVNGNGGMQYRVALSSLPPHAQIKWLRENLEQAKSLSIDIVKRLDPSARQALAELIAKEEIDPKEYHMVEAEEVEEFNKKSYAVKQYLLNPCYRTAEALAKELGVHPATIYRWVQDAKEGEHRAVLTIDDTPVRIKLPRTKLPEDVLLESLNIILAHPKARISQGYKYICEKGFSEISYSQYTRLLKQMEPPFEKILKYHRSGRIAALLSDTPKIIRAWTKLPVMHTIVGDQHYMDYYFYSEELEDIVRVTLYIWMDCSSRYIVSCVPAIGNYTQWHVQASLIEAFRIHTPDEIYTDWGKQENAKATEELIARLGSGHIHIGSFDDFIDKYPDSKISRKHSTPGVPPVKPIESGIRRLTEFLNQKGLTGYMKRDMQDPFRAKQIQEKLKEDMRSGRLISVEEGLEILKDAIFEANTTEIKTEEGKSFVPSQFFWQDLKGRRVVWSDYDLAMLLYPRFQRKVSNASIKITLSGKKIVLTAKELTWVRDGERVTVCLNPFPPHDAIVLRQKGEEWEYFCTAQAWIGYAVDPRDQERLQRAMEIKYSYLRQFVLALREIHEYKPAEQEAPVQRIAEVSHLSRKLKHEILPEIKKTDYHNKNWQALGELARKLGY